MPQEGSAEGNDRAAASPAPPASASTAAAAAASGGACLLGLSEDVVARLVSAASMLRMSPNDFTSYLLRNFYSSLRGLPPHVLLFIFTFLDYSTVSALVALTCRDWHDAVKKGEPSKFFSALRQIHGVHVLDPVRGIFYFPRALKRVLMMPNVEGESRERATRRDSTTADAPTGGPPPMPPSRATAVSPSASAPAQTLSAVAGDMAAPASSFLTVDIRTQDARSLPWSNIRSVVQRAIESERLAFGEVRSVGLQRPEEPALTQAAVVTYSRMVYVCGGESYEGVVLARCYAYDPAKKRWNGLPQLREARAGACAVGFGGRLFVFGGYNQAGEVLDTYEVLDIATSRWLNPVVVNGSRGFHMPSKACGLAVAVHEDVVFLVGGYRSRLAPEDTAFTYSIANSATTTPMHGTAASTTSVFSLVTPGGSGAAAEASAGTPPTGHTATSARAAAHSISRDGPLDAEAWVWVFAPRDHTWCADGPPLPSPRAFGGLAVLELSPALGPCLCYFGGCAKADAPQTTMLYMPLLAEAQALGAACASCAAAAPPPPQPHMPEEDETCSTDVAVSDEDLPASDTSFLRSATAVSAISGKSLNDESSTATTTATAASAATPPPPSPSTKPSVERGKPARDARLLRYFRQEPSNGGRGAETFCEWQRYARVPLGGALTSVAVLGAAHSRTVVLSSFYPAALIGCCKVRDLVPSDVTLRLAQSLSRRPPPAATAAATRAPQETTSLSSPTAPPLNASPACGASASTPPPPRELSRASSSPSAAPPVPLDAGLQLEALASTQQQRSLEQEWSQHQRRELRHLMGAAATAASHKRPIAPQTAGEQRKWSLAPMAEIQVRDDRGRPLLNRVSWKTQCLNGKFVIGIE